MLQVNADVRALINDTTGTLLAVAGKKVPDCHIGLILGTGTNACYMEKFDKATASKFDKPENEDVFHKHTQIIVNCEWGAFGEGGQLETVMTSYDKELDENKEVANPGKQL